MMSDISCSIPDICLTNDTIRIPDASPVRRSLRLRPAGMPVHHEDDSDTKATSHGSMITSLAGVPHQQSGKYLELLRLLRKISIT
jgi:hypothetical protein